MPSGTEEEERIQADLTADEVQTQMNLELLNQSMLRDLEKIVKDNPPAADLWPHLRKASAEYKANMAKLVEKPKPVSESKEPSPEPENDLRHVVPEGDISILWPLTPKLNSLLRDPTSSSEDAIQNARRTSVSRSALLRLLKRGDLLYQYFTRAVVRIAPDVVVKINKSKDVTELINLQHIRAASRTIPVPAPLGMLSVAHFSYVFTSFVPGIPLDRIWGNLTSHQKENVREQLNYIFIELRTLPLPSEEGYLGGGNPPVCKINRRWTKRSSSPIVNETQFNDFLLSGPYSNLSRIDYLRASLPSNHRIVMTHSDLHPRNLIVDSEHTVRIVGIVDWELGGGYPEYWEYVQALNSSFITKEDDWHLFLPEAGIGKFFDEYARDSIIGRMVT